jgi:hypothetical protein
LLRSKVPLRCRPKVASNQPQIDLDGGEANVIRTVLPGHAAQMNLMPFD